MVARILREIWSDRGHGVEKFISKLRNSSKSGKIDLSCISVWNGTGLYYCQQIVACSSSKRFVKALSIVFILGCLKTTSSSDVLLDLNLKTLIHRREISILRYFPKIIFRLVPCPLPLNLFRSFGEFVPYTLRHSLDQGRTQGGGGGLGLKPLSWAWYFTKTVLPSQGD